MRSVPAFLSEGFIWGVLGGTSLVFFHLYTNLPGGLFSVVFTVSLCLGTRLAVSLFGPHGVPFSQVLCSQLCPLVVRSAVVPVSPLQHLIKSSGQVAWIS